MRALQKAMNEAVLEPQLTPEEPQTRTADKSRNPTAPGCADLRLEVHDVAAAKQRASAGWRAIDEGGPCIHYGSTLSSMWRNNRDGEQVCRTNDCWREEGWMEQKKQRGRPPTAGGRAAQQGELSLQSYISSIIYDH